MQNSETPVRRYADTPIRRQRRYADNADTADNAATPLRRNAATPLRRYADAPMRRYAETPIRRYAGTPVRRYAETPLRRNADTQFTHRTIGLLPSPAPRRLPQIPYFSAMY